MIYIQFLSATDHPNDSSFDMFKANLAIFESR